MAGYPELSIPSPRTGELFTAVPTGYYRVEFTRPKSDIDLRRIVPGGLPVTPGASLAVTVSLEGLEVEDIRAFAAARETVSAVLPIYEVDGHHFAPKAGTLLIRADSGERANQILEEALRRVVDDPTSALAGLEPRGALFDGLWEFGMNSGFKEPSVEIGVYAEGGSAVCIDAEHPDSLAVDVSESVEPAPYNDRFDPYDPIGTENEMVVGTVAILDSYFEFDHDALNFREKGITTVEWDIRSIDQHGTSCAGVVGARPESGFENAAGELPWTELIAVRVFERGLGAFAEVALAKGIKAAVQQGAGVISISLGTPWPTSCALKLAATFAAKHEVVVVAGSGNAVIGTVGGVTYNDKDEPIVYPAAYPEVIAVGAGETTNNEPARCQDVPSLGGNAHWSSRYVSSGDDLGLDVVAQGRDVITTNLLQPTDNTTAKYWNQFLGTSAAAPIVAGLAAKIRQHDVTLSTERVRALIQCLAHLPGKAANVQKRVSGFGYRNYSYQLGFGWIDQDLDLVGSCFGSGPDHDVEHEPVDEPESNPPQSDEEPEGPMTVDKRRSPVLNDECTQIDCDRLVPDKPYPDVSECARPLSVFLKALADRRCCTLLYDFLDKPYLTAYTAGVPYAAAVWLGSGDWEKVDQALMAENDLVQSSVAAIYAVLGPIWVKAL